MPHLGCQIKQSRKAYGMSQAELARRVDISQTSLHLIEAGTTHDPHFSIVARIAEVLGLSLDVFADQRETHT